MSDETIEDVARHAGVSIGTVSRVLNGTKKVSPETRARVLAAIEELHYSRNAVAHRLRSRSNKMIALMVSDLANPIFEFMIAGIEEVVYEHGYALLLCNSNESVSREAQHVAVLDQERIAGLIVIPVSVSGAVLRPLISRGVPVVSFDRRFQDVSLDTVTLDNQTGGRMATEHLLSLGHRRIGVITSMTSTAGIERRDGYVEALAMAGIAVEESLVRDGAFRADRAYQAMGSLLSEATRPTAMLVANFPMVVGALQALHEHGLAVPTDVSLIGFDDTPWLPYMRPPLTVVSQPYKALGQAAARVLLDRIAVGSADAPPQNVVCAPFLVIRGSTAPVTRPHTDGNRHLSAHDALLGIAGTES